MAVAKDTSPGIEPKEEIVFWKSLKNGEKSGLEALYRLYAQQLFRYGMAVIPDKSLVKDAVQDLFLDLWKYRENLVETDNVRLYLCRSITNRLIKLSLKEKTRSNPNVFEIHSSLYATESQEYVLEINHEDEFIRSRLESAISHLPNRQKKVIQLVYYNKLSCEKVSQLMGINLQSVYNLTSKAIISLRKNMVSLSLVIVLAYFLLLF